MNQYAFQWVFLFEICFQFIEFIRIDGNHASSIILLIDFRFFFCKNSVLSVVVLNKQKNEQISISKTLITYINQHS